MTPPTAAGRSPRQAAKIVSVIQRSVAPPTAARSLPAPSLPARCRSASWQRPERPCTFRAGAEVLPTAGRTWRVILSVSAGRRVAGERDGGTEDELGMAEHPDGRTDRSRDRRHSDVACYQAPGCPARTG